ncbi:hypothetical protein [Terasakiella pusilla]|uniref:hypothetical protein n=1 Tax=Terasakiella pusilla TaxID=64973 RepID=UPI003AA7FEFF
MRSDEYFIRKVDDLRRDREDFPSRAQIIREAVEAAHAAKEKTPEAGTSRV